MNIFASIAEQRIREAIERGEFDNQAYHGKPLNLDELAGIPEPLRMGYKILQNAGVLPPEMQLKKEIVSLQNLLDACGDAEEQEALRTNMNEKMLRFSLMMEKHRHKPGNEQYYSKILKKLGR